MLKFLFFKISNFLFYSVLSLLAFFAIFSGIWASFIGAKNLIYFLEMHNWLRSELLFLSSFLANMALGTILVVSGILSLDLTKVRSRVNMWDLFKPTPISIFVFVILSVLTSLSFFDRVYTTKITWIDSRGAPFTYLILSDQLFACNPNTIICLDKTIESFSLLPFLINILLCYYAVSMFFSYILKLRAA